MKRFLFIAAFALLILNIFGQTGYLDLYYGENYASARKKLENKGFIIINNQNVLKKFTAEYYTDVYAVDLILNPRTDYLAGWTLYFNDKMSDAVEVEVANKLIEMHGNVFDIREDMNMLTWTFSDMRSLVVAMNSDGSINMAVYYDEKYNEVFEQSEEQNRQWHQRNRE